MPGPVEVGEDHPLAGADAAVGRALATAVGGAARAACTGRVLEGDGAAVERRVDDGGVGGGAVEHGRGASRAVRGDCHLRAERRGPREGPVRCIDLTAREQDRV